MPSDWKEDTEKKSEPQETKAVLGQEGVQSMQGKLGADSDTNSGEQDSVTAAKIDQSLQAELEKYEDMYDPDRFEYKKGSPHADYQNYNDLLAAQRKHELGQQAATADSLPDAVSTALAAREESKSADDETSIDKYFYEKYGRAPYTEGAYPEDDE